VKFGHHNPLLARSSAEFDGDCLAGALASQCGEQVLGRFELVVTESGEDVTGPETGFVCGPPSWTVSASAPRVVSGSPSSSAICRVISPNPKPMKECSAVPSAWSWSATFTAGQPGWRT
jgi:hypothetical protein